MVEIKRYIKKPVEVEAVLLTEDNFVDVYDWVENEGTNCEPFTTGQGKGGNEGLIISTMEGNNMVAYPNKHYIVKGVRGEFYPVEKDIFEDTYVEVCEEGKNKEVRETAMYILDNAEVIFKRYCRYIFIYDIYLDGKLVGELHYGGDRDSIYKHEVIAGEKKPLSYYANIVDVMVALMNVDGKYENYIIIYSGY